MISTTNLQQAKNEIKKSTPPIIVKAQNLEFNRNILEYGKFQIFLSPELSSDTKKDKLKQINSGFNHVLAKIAAGKNIAIGINLAELQVKDKKEKALLVSKIKQNIKIARKAKCKLKIINYKDKKDAEAFLTSLGASTQQISQAF